MDIESSRRTKEILSAVYGWVDHIIPTMIEGDHEVLIILLEQFRLSLTKEAVHRHRIYCLRSRI